MQSEVLSRIECGCRVSGCHAVSTVIVAADNRDVVRLCLRHAKDWSNSDLCRDFAATGHTNSLRVLAKWLLLKSQTETACAVPLAPARPISGPQHLFASGAR
jgi:hypothetical protein